MVIMEKLTAVVVAFNPDVEKIRLLCQSLVGESISVVIVDNTPKPFLYKFISVELACIVNLNENLGIAKAQNVGIKLALDNNANSIIFFDQDSTINYQLILNLVEMSKELDGCVVAPLCLNESDGVEYPSQIFGRFSLPIDIFLGNKVGPQSVDIVISSGMLVPASVFEIVGFFDESFFIDFVDIEWCIRCRSAGIPIYVIPEAVMLHQIGTSVEKHCFFTVCKHSPQRTYYKVRNSFLLLWKNVPKIFCFRQILPAILHNFMACVFFKPRKEYCIAYLKGLFDGLLGRSGRWG